MMMRGGARGSLAPPSPLRLPAFMPGAVVAGPGEGPVLRNAQWLAAARMPAASCVSRTGVDSAGMAAALATPERILVVDDHPLVRDGLRSLLAITFEDCEILEAAGVEEACQVLAAQGECDLVLLDLNMPDATRLSGLTTLRQAFPMVPVLMVSGSFDRALVQEALSAGAAGFLPKSLKRAAIVDALHQVMSGEIYIPDTGLEEAPGTAEEVQIRARIDSLTPQQKVVLHHLVHGRLNKQIAHDLDVSLTTVKAHVSAILQKLGVFSRTQAVILANRIHFD
jgi:DNA-binding NarL/FixJ family response regulator